MAALKVACLGAVMLFHIGCMSLVLEDSQTDIPMSLSAHLSGYQVQRTEQFFREEVWVYHLWNIQHWPLGTLQDGLRYDHLLHDVAHKYVGAGQGVINLRVRHERNVLTILSAIFTLGIMTPTAVVIEGDIVDLTPLKAIAQ